MAGTKPIHINIHEAKTHLSKYLEKIAKGHTVVLCKRNVPIAEIRPLPKVVDRRKLFGMDKGKVIIPPEFFDPMTEEFPEHYETATPESMAREREAAEFMKRLNAGEIPER
jgi:antitoxin (DNA-binding transcriptional repressor) of toxin-antitoxin stability system